MSLLQTFKNQLNVVPSSVWEQRQVALFADVEAQGLPTRKVEDWKYTSLKELSQKTFLKPLSSQFVVRSSFNLQNLVDVFETLQISTPDIFDKLNLASLTQGYYLEVPRNTDAESAIEIDLNVLNNEYQNVFLYVRLQENSHIRIREISDVQSGFLNFRLILDLGPQSSCEHLRIFKNAKSSEAFIISGVETLQSRTSRYKMVQIGEGAKLLRQNIACHLKGEGAQAELYGFSSLASRLSVDNHIVSNHWVPHTVSRQFFKTILHDHTHSVFQGKIFIEKEAQKSDADQLSKHLVLSEKSQVDAKPQLDVYADDVKATHGAAIGQLDADELFYLQSRGLSRDQAIQLLISGFGSEIAQKLENQNLKTFALQYLAQNMEMKNV